MLGRYWQDIKEKNNLELYVTIFACFAITICDWLGLITDSWQKLIAPIALLIAAGVLQLSLKVDGLRRETSKGELSRVIHEFPVDLGLAIKSAKTIDLVGVHFSSIFADHANEFNEFLIRGGVLTAIMVPENSGAATMTASRFEGHVTLIQENARIQSCKTTLSDWATKYNGKVKVREKDYLFEKSLAIFDRKSSAGYAVEQCYTFKVSGGSKKPKFLMRSGTEWYEIVNSEYEKHWATGSVVV
jgi:hypothetical protein